MPNEYRHVISDLLISAECFIINDKDLEYLPLEYRHAVKKLSKAIYDTTDLEEQRQSFVEFSKNYTMHIDILRKWKELEIQYRDFLTLKERETYINVVASSHFYDENLLKFSFTDSYEFPILDKVLAAYKMDNQNFHGYANTFLLEYKKVRGILNFPNQKLQEYWEIFQTNSLSPITTEMEEKQKKLIKLWNKIDANKENPIKWIRCLQESNDHKFIVQNIEVVLSKKPFTKIAWKEYISYLKTVDIREMLNVYSRYCHFFIWDWKMREVYLLEIVQLCHKKYDAQKWIDDYYFLNTKFPCVLDAHTVLHHLFTTFITTKSKLIFNLIKSSKNNFTHISSKKTCNKNLKQKFHKNDEILDSNFVGFRLPLFEYIIANASHKMLSKFYSISKWFFKMRKAPLCYRLGIYDSSKTFSFEHSFFITPTDLDHNGLKNIFVTNSIVSNSLDCYAVQKILPKLFKCDAKVIKIDNQILSFDQFCFLVGEGSVEKISFRNVSVQWKSGEKVAVEFLIERLPNAKCLEFLNAEFNSETSQQLGKIQLLNKIEHFSLGDIDETFEIFGFSKFIQNNGNADSHYTLHFKRIVATAFKFEFEKNLDMAVNPYRHRHASSVRKPEINIY